jgi:hypothetical protein
MQMALYQGVNELIYKRLKSKRIMAKTIPDSDAGFDAKQELITSSVGQRLAELGVDSTWYQKLLKSKMRWVTAFAVCRNPATRTKPALKEKRAARKEYQGMLSQLVDIVKASPGATTEYLDSLEIAHNKGGGGTETPPTHQKPLMRVRLITSGMIEIDFLNSESGKHGKPVGGNGILLALGIAGADPDDHDSDKYRMAAPAVDQEQLPFRMYITNGKVIMAFKKHQAGLQVEASSCWTNATGKRGPWSDIIIITIP